MTFTDFIRRMPKVELHARLEDSIRRETLLKLARCNADAIRHLARNAADASLLMPMQKSI